MNNLDDKINQSYLEKIECIISNLNSKNKHTLLIIDDEENTVQLLNRTLRHDYEILTASNPIEAMHILDDPGNDISLIISDQIMPEMNGTDFFRNIVTKYPNIIRILLTGHSDFDTLMKGINECELFQYIIKPFEPEDLKAVVKKGILDFEKSNNKKSLINDLKELFFTTIKSISSAIDAKDAYTHGHSYRVTLYALILAGKCNIETKIIEDIETAGLLHDVGKIGVAERILCKPGKLTDDEFSMMKSHPERGQKMLLSINQLKEVAYFVSCHHERWDGRGYPYGLKEKEIPFVSRIISIADTYDAMTSDRSYRKKLNHDFAVEEIIRCSGMQFDPELVEIFKTVVDEFQEASDNPVEFYTKYSLLNKMLRHTQNDQDLF